MSWPKKHTRKLHHDGVEYLWQCPNPEYKYEATIGKEDDPYYITLDLEFSGVWSLVQPSEIKRGLVWALDNGWSPSRGPSKFISMRSNEFQWV